MQSKLLLKISTTAVLLLAGASSYAGPLWAFESINPSGNHAAGRVLSINSTFDESSNIFSWSYRTNNPANDGFWLVVSDGPNPKGGRGEYGIMYGDLDTNRLSVYEYNGRNSADSYRTEELLQTFDGVFSVIDALDGTRSISFSIDATDINDYYNAIDAPDWAGIRFGSRIGYWFHPSLDSRFTYGDGDPTLEGFRYATQGWYDKKDLTTTAVPEPDTILLLLLGVLGIVAVRRQPTRGFPGEQRNG